MTTVNLKFTKKSDSFIHHYFEVNGLPMNTHNTLLLSEYLNPSKSIYIDANFSVKANGSSYDINFMGNMGNKLYEDTDEMIKFIEQVFITIKDKIKERNKN